MRVLIAGDSHLARARPRQHEIAEDVTNRAIGGAVATDLVGQVANLDPSAYDVVLVSVGTNDAGWREVPLPVFCQAVEAFLGWAGSTPLLLMTSPGCDETRAAGHWSDARLAQYAGDAGALAKAAGGSVLDTPAVLAPLGSEAFLEDGFHLTSAAYDLLLPALADRAEELRREGA